MEQTHDPYDDKKELAIAWFNKSSDLRGSAAALWTCVEPEVSASIVERLGLGAGFNLSAATRSVYRMLCGMSLELMYKAILVARKEGVPHTHGLIALAQRAIGVVDERDEGLLLILTESIIWAGRYPVPKDRAHYERLGELHSQHLFDHIPFGRFQIAQPNGALSWANFNRLWETAHDIYWQHAA